MRSFGLRPQDDIFCYSRLATQYVILRNDAHARIVTKDLVFMYNV